MKKKWYITDERMEPEIPDVDPLIQKILKKREVTGKEEIYKFLYSDLKDLHDPFLMLDLKRAVKRIMTAREQKERVIIYGDYDVDGITSITLLYTYFKEALGMEVDYYIPNRLKEGYGLNSEAVKKIAAQGYNLMITVDCGISAAREVKLARSRGLDIVITDHHQTGDSLPEALAVIDPHRKDDNYPFKSLAGVGVAFKLCQGLEMQVKGQIFTPLLEKLLDLVTLGSIADIVPLRGENRIIVREGLKNISKTSSQGLRALVDKVGLSDKVLNAGQIGYILAPPLNAAGRMKDPELGISLLTTNSRQEAIQLAEKLVTLNKDRQAEEERIFNEALEMLENEIDLKQSSAIVLASSGWHHGVIGIVASRLVEKYYRPTILIAVEDGKGKGSCRSISNLNIFQALRACSDDLTGFGGHAMAAGLEISGDKIEGFRKRFNKLMTERLSDEDLIPRLELDSIIEPEEINLKLYKKLDILKPYGVGNPGPRFLMSKIRFGGSYPVGKDGKHLKFNLKNGLKGIGFGYGQLQTELSHNELDLAFTISLNEWKGEKEVQVRLEDYNIRDSIDYFPIIFKLKDWSIADKRGCSDHFSYLKKIYKKNTRSAVYMNSPSLCRRFKEWAGGDNIFLASNKSELNDFYSRGNGILLFTNTNFSEEINIDDLIFSSLPFSREEMARILDIFAGGRSSIHLLFGRKELEINKKLIRGMLPDDKFLRQFYLYLRALPQKNILYSDIKNIVAKEVNFSYDRRLINKSLTILSEIGLLDRFDDSFKLLAPPGEKLDLSDSISYNDIIDTIKGFKEFTGLVFTNNLFQLFFNLRKGEVEKGRKF